MPPPIIAIEIGSVKANRQIKSIKKNIADLRTMVDRLGRSVKQVDFSRIGARGATPGLKSLNTEVNKNVRSTRNLSRQHKRLKTSLDKGSKAAGGMKQRVTELSKSIQIALGPLSGVAARLTAFSSLATGASLAIAGFIAGLIGMIALFVKTVNAGREMEKQLLVIQGLIKSTGGAAGFTATQIDTLAQSIAFSTLASVKDAREAAAALLTFVAISGKEFERTLRLSQDLAQLGFGSMRNAAVQLGKALEDPRIGLSALRRVGVSFTPELREQIILFAELGRTAQATGLILKTIEEQTGGAGVAAATGLTGAIDNLADSFTALFEELARQKGLLATLESIARGVALLADDARRALKAPTIRELEERAKGARERFTGARQRLFQFDPSKPSDDPINRAMLEFQARRVSGKPGPAGLQKGIERILQPFLDELIEAQSLLNEATNKFVKDVTEAQEAELAGKAKKAVNELNTLKSTFNKLREAIDPGFKAQKDFNKGLAVLNDMVSRGNLPLAERDRLLIALAIRAENAAGSTRFLSKSQREANRAAAQANRILKSLIETRNRAFKATDQQIQSLLRESEALLISGKNRKIELEVLKAEIRLKRAGIELDKEATRSLLDRVRRAAELREETKAAVKDETEALRDFTRVISTAFEDALVKGASFRDLLRSIEEDLIRIVTRIAITKPFEAALTTAIQGGKLDKDAEGIEKIGFFLGDILKNIFGLGNQSKQNELRDQVAKALTDEALARGRNIIVTKLADTAIQDMAVSAVKASIALGTLAKVAAEKSGFNISDLLSGIVGGGSPTPGADFTAANIDFLGFTAKGGVRNKRGKVRSFDSGGISDGPSIAVFGEKRGEKEAFVPLPKSGKIPVEIVGGVKEGDVNVNFFITTPDADSFRQSQGQLMADALRFVQSGQRNT